MAGLEEIRTGLQPIWATHSFVEAVWIFGSVATGKNQPDSDVDVAVLCAGPLTLAQEGELVSHIMGALRRNDVDCVNMELAPPFLQFRILRDGVLVLDRNPVRRVSFTARAWSTYFDLQPALDTYYGLTRAR